MKLHRAGLHEGFLTTFSLKLDGLSTANHDAIVADIDRLAGIDRVDILSKNSVLKVTYDASVLSIDTILSILTEYGANVHSGWWNRIKFAWDREIDKNIKNNAASSPHCCNKPPVRIFRKK